MKIMTCVGESDKELEKYREDSTEDGWELVISGIWEDAMSHSGRIAYYVQRTSSGYWILNGVDRNNDVFVITEDDVEEGRLDDDSRQALLEKKFEEARNLRFERISAVLLGASGELSSEEAARLLYDSLVQAGGKAIVERDWEGLLE